VLFIHVNFFFAGETVGDRLVRHLQPLIDRYESLEWRGCRGSAPRYGGYPCGLWSLFHTLTVRQLAAQRGRPTQVLAAMVGYIQQFFSCRECAQHFVEATRGGADFASVVSSYETAVLYLWGKHNEVNRRLAAEATNEDPVYPKADFPAADFCPECVSRDGRGWSRDHVLEFLIGQYSTPVGASGGGGLSSGGASVTWFNFTAVAAALIFTLVG
jgi:thiol oxidase